VKREKKYHGVVVPMVTPFRENGSLDEAAALRIIDHLISGGSSLFLLGTTGEAASIPFETRLQLVKTATKHINQKTLIYAGISDNCQDNSLNLVEKFHDLGVDVFVTHLPSYYPLTAELMLKYYETLAEHCSGPIMIYNIKSTTNMSIPLEVIEQLSHHPNIIGLKDSERDLDRLKMLAKMFKDRPDFSLFCGWTAQSAPTLLIGFDGMVPSTANIIPRIFIELYQAASRGDKTTAMQLQIKIDSLVNIHQTNMLPTQVIAALKVIMSEFGFCEPSVLPPLSRLSAEQENQIKTQLHEIRNTLHLN